MVSQVTARNLRLGVPAGNGHCGSGALQGQATTNNSQWLQAGKIQVVKGCRALKRHSRKMSIPSWQAKGVVPGGQLTDQLYALVSPEAGASSGYLVGGNYRAILNYNCADKYAVSVGLLSEAIARPD